MCRVDTAMVNPTRASQHLPHLQNTLSPLQIHHSPQIPRRLSLPRATSHPLPQPPPTVCLFPLLPISDPPLPVPFPPAVGLQVFPGRGPAASRVGKWGWQALWV
uniref:Uncharacterized protein n=1 Tax=Rhizophora mucronata TaxID=61149 RepID=A0A2P2MXF4_RHIMU